MTGTLRVPVTCCLGFCSKTAFTYDPLNRPETLTYPDGEVVTYTYDRAGRVNGLTADEGAAVYLQDAGYDALGQPTSLALGAGVISTTIQYYTAGEVSAEPPFALQSIQAASVVSDLLELRDYAYHPDGNPWGVKGTTRRPGLRPEDRAPSGQLTRNTISPKLPSSDQRGRWE